MTGVLNITLFGLSHTKLMRKADPNRVRGEKRSCEVCKSVNDTSRFKKRNTNETFKILKGPLDCNSNHAIYLFECKQCRYRFPYVGSTKIKFSYRINNYKSTQRKFINMLIKTWQL